MARRRSRKGAKNQGVLMGAAVAGCAVLGGLLFFAFGNKHSDASVRTKAADLDMKTYRDDASRLAGNSYRITGCVENIVTVGETRVLAVSLPNQRQERLPLVLPKSVKLNTNITRGDSFVFTVICRNGRSETSELVKGVMVVQNAEVK